MQRIFAEIENPDGTLQTCTLVNEEYARGNGYNPKNELQIFEHEQFGEIREITINGEPWFAEVDVCRVLGIKNNRDALSRLDDDEKMVIDLTDGHSGMRGGAQMIAIISTPGLYALTLSSRKPEAKPFRRWVTHDVLPSIQKRLRGTN